MQHTGEVCAVSSACATSPPQDAVFVRCCEPLPLTLGASPSRYLPALVLLHIAGRLRRDDASQAAQPLEVEQAMKGLA